MIRHLSGIGTVNMRQYCEALRAAIETGAVPAALEALVGIAEALIERGELARAAEILALVLCYPMHRDTREMAEAMFMDLEGELYPRVIIDAKARAEVLTLDDMATDVLAEMAE